MVSFSPRLTLKRQRGHGLWITSFEWPAYKEFHLTLQPLPKERPTEMVRRLATVLKEKNAIVVRHEIFGSVAEYAETMRILQQEVRNFDWPVMWIGGGTDAENGISGMHVFAVAATHVDTICQEGEPVGRIFSDGHVRHCLLGNLLPSNPSVSKSVQCRETFEKTERLLFKAGMQMANVVRTWFFLDDILSWYEEFNDIRTEFFRERKLLNGLLPASTGVGGRNPAGTVIIGGAWAVQATGNPVAAHAVPSPLQCSSMEYGSAFSRAVSVATSSCRRLLISGTASIGPEPRQLRNEMSALGPGRAPTRSTRSPDGSSPTARRPTSDNRQNLRKREAGDARRPSARTLSARTLCRRTR